MKTLADAWDAGVYWLARKYDVTITVPAWNPYRNNAIEAARERVIDVAKAFERRDVPGERVDEAVRALRKLEGKVEK